MQKCSAMGHGLAAGLVELGWTCDLKGHFQLKQIYDSVILFNKTNLPKTECKIKKDLSF